MSTEQGILDATLDVVSRVGLARLALDDVARQAGVSRQTVYRYFGSRDGLVRAVILREEQILFDEGGHETARVPVDTATTAQIVIGDMKPTRGPADLVQQIVKSGKPQACLARQMYRFTFAAEEDEVSDGCALERMRIAVERGSLRSLFREAALTGAFSRRVIPEVAP